MVKPYVCACRSPPQTKAVLSSFAKKVKRRACNEPGSIDKRRVSQHSKEDTDEEKRRCGLVSFVAHISIWDETYILHTVPNKVVRLYAAPVVPVLPKAAKSGSFLNTSRRFSFAVEVSSLDRSAQAIGRPRSNVRELWRFTSSTNGVGAYASCRRSKPHCHCMPKPA